MSKQGATPAPLYLYKYTLRETLENDETCLFQVLRKQDISNLSKNYGCMHIYHIFKTVYLDAPFPDKSYEKCRGCKSRYLIPILSQA